MKDDIQIAEWAACDENGNLSIASGIDLIQMYESDGKGSPLLKFNKFGADIIQFGAGKGVQNHTHEGDHILFVVSGTGFVEYNGKDYPLKPGLCYLIPGNVDHAIKATTELVLIAVGNNHQPLESSARMTPVAARPAPSPFYLY